MSPVTIFQYYHQMLAILGEHQAASKMDEFLTNNPFPHMDKMQEIILAAASSKNPYTANTVVATLIKRFPHWKDAQGTDKVNLLMTAARRGHMDLFQGLLDLGLDPGARDGEQLTVLDWATRHYNHPNIQEAVIKTVLASHPFTQKDLAHALGEACSYDNVGAVRALIQAGAQIDTFMIDGNQRNPIQIISNIPAQPDSDRVENFGMEREQCGELILDMLLPLATPQQINAGWGRKFPQSALHQAAWAGNTHTISTLIAHGAWVNPPDTKRFAGQATPLMRAAMALQVEACDVLLKAGADIAAVDHDGNNVLHHVSDDKYFISIEDQQTLPAPMIEWLIDAGADPHHVNKEGQTPSQLAAHRGWEHMAQLMDGIVLRRELTQQTDGMVQAAPKSLKM